MTVDLTMEEQSVLDNVAVFIDMHWPQFVEFCDSEDLTVPTEEEYESVMTKVTGRP